MVFTEIQRLNKMLKFDRQQIPHLKSSGMMPIGTSHHNADKCASFKRCVYRLSECKKKK